MTSEQGNATGGIDLRGDHAQVADHAACRRYFDKFGAIIAHLHAVAVAERRERGVEGLEKIETDAIEGYLVMLSHSLTALATKYQLTGLVDTSLTQKLSIDQTESGFPVYSELLELGSDRSRLDDELARLPAVAKIKQQMIDHMIEQLALPRRLQFALSQRLYFEMLRDKPLFLTQNEPQAVWLGNTPEGARRYLIHWAVYDSQSNLPVVYTLIVGDSAERILSKDEQRWAAVKTHLLAQSISSLKLLTIAMGFDRDFPTLHPKHLKRVTIGPMYAAGFTQQHDSIGELIAAGGQDPQQDWVLAWTNETLVSKQTTRRRSGLFGESLEEVYDIDTLNAGFVDAGVTQMERAMILPERPFQALSDGRRGSFGSTRIYVVSPGGTVLAA